MQVIDYLKARNETQKAFAARSGCSYRTVHRAARGETVGTTAIRRIVAAAQAAPTEDGGVIEYADLLPISQGDAA